MLQDPLRRGWQPADGAATTPGSGTRQTNNHLQARVGQLEGEEHSTPIVSPSRQLRSPAVVTQAPAVSAWMP